MQRPFAHATAALVDLAPKLAAGIGQMDMQGAPVAGIRHPHQQAPRLESSDVFGHRVKLPAATEPDDTLLIADAGAYGFSMASAYNLRTLPAEDVLPDPG